MSVSYVETVTIAGDTSSAITVIDGDTAQITVSTTSETVVEVGSATGPGDQGR